MSDLTEQSERLSLDLTTALSRRSIAVAHDVIDQMFDLAAEYDQLMAATQQMAGEKSQDWQAAA